MDCNTTHKICCVILCVVYNNIIENKEMIMSAFVEKHKVQVMMRADLINFIEKHSSERGVTFDDAVNIMLMKYSVNISNDLDECRPSGNLHGFDEFWDLYDKKVGKKECKIKWRKLTKSQKSKIFDTLPSYIDSRPRKEYRKDPIRYLRKECWEDEIIESSDTCNDDELSKQKYESGEL